MNAPATFVLLALVAAVVSLVARRLRVPYTVALVLAGLALGATHALAAPTLTHDLMFGLVLPALIFEAAFDLELQEVRRDGVTLVALAVPGVAVAIVITVLALPPSLRAMGVPAAGVPVRAGALVFAALMSATDPVAVVALFRALDAPRRLQVIIEGESLLNDGTAIVFFTLALGAAGAGLSASLVTDFLYVIGAGIIVGGVIGAASAEAIRRLSEPTLELLLTTIAAYGSFAAAEAVGASGVIATVTAGLLCGRRAGRIGMSATARIAAGTFWEYAAFAFNSLVFLSIGFMVRIPTLLANWRAILVAFAIVTIARAVVVSGIAALLPERLRIPHRWTAVLSWGGLRGALSMVLALSIPDSFPQRDAIVTLTFGVVVLSILLQGVTVGPAVRWLGLRRQARAHSGYVDTQRALLSAHSALADVERTASMVATDDGMHRALADEYDDVLEQAERDLVALGEQLGGGEAAAEAARRLLADAERARIADAFRAGAIGAEQRDERLAALRRRWWNDGSPPENP